MINVDRLRAHVEWLRGDHAQCNPFLADDIDALLIALQKIKDAIPKAKEPKP